MGERDLSQRPAATRSRRPAIGWLALGSALAALVLVAALDGPAPPRGEAAAWLAAARHLRGGEPAGQALGPEQGGRRERAVAPPGALVYPLLLAGLLTGGVRGAAAGQALLVAIAALVAARLLAARIGPRAPLLVLVFVFGSIVFVDPFQLVPASLLTALTVVAVALAAGSETSRGEATPQVYREPPAARPRRLAGRWVLVGLALGAVVVHRPLALLLLVAVVAAAPRGGRAPALLGLAGGTAAVLGASGLWGWLHAGRVGAWSALGGEAFVGSLPASLPSFAELGHGAWALLLGRDIGLVPYFLPVALCLALWTGAGPRGWLVAAATAAVLLLLLAPQRLSGGSPVLACRPFVPFYAALWLLPDREPRLGWLGASLLAAALFLYPAWSDPASAAAGGPEGVGYVGRIASRWLPGEPFEEGLPVREIRLGEVVVRLPPGSPIEATTAGRFRMPGRGRSELVLASDRHLSGVYLTFDRSAPSGIEVRGGRLASTVFRPDGGVSFHVELATESVPRDTRGLWLYPLTIRFASSPPRELEFGLAPEIAGGGEATA